MIFHAFTTEKKRRITSDGPSLVAASSSKSAPSRPKNNATRSVVKPQKQPNEPVRSTVVERLASFNPPVAKSTGSQVTRDYRYRRDESLALVENLIPGPYQHKNIPDDPNFDGFEPHSSIRLSYVHHPHVIAYTLMSGAPPP